MTVRTALAPVLPAPTPPAWGGAVWVGAADVADLLPDPLTGRPAGDVQLDGAAGFVRARILVRDGRTPRGFVEVPVVDGVVPADALARAVAALPVPANGRAEAGARIPAQRGAAAPATGRTCPPMSVVVCTRERPEQLAVALASLVRLADAHPGELEVVVVDNAPLTTRTREVVEALQDSRFRVVLAPVAGLSRARNTGLLAARHDLVAFTDDDVVVDAGWLAALAGTFAASGPDLGCVCGMVPSAELRSPSQVWFDRRVSWGRSTTPRVFSLRAGRRGDPLFPFRVGHYGTGANFALRRSAALALGGFDEGLGIGSPTGGGEDIDMFVRVLLSGRSLAYVPSAVVWHRHRADAAGLRRQVRDYGTGLGAWITTLALRPRTAAMLVRRALPGVRHALRITRVTLPAPPADVATPGPVPDDAAPDDVAGERAVVHRAVTDRAVTDHVAAEVAALADLGALERSAVVAGALALLAARRAGARRRPLAGSPVKETR